MKEKDNEYEKYIDLEQPEKSNKNKKYIKSKTKINRKKFNKQSDYRKNAKRKK